MAEDDLSVGSEDPAAVFGHRKEIGPAEVVQHFRQHDEVEGAVREFGRQHTFLEGDVRRRVLSRSFQRRAGRVDRQQFSAALREPCRQDPDRAANFEDTIVMGARKSRQSAVIFLPLVGAGSESPGVDILPVPFLEV
ncbi:hypothetical protein A4A58_19290 [Tardiphaga robiniae]|uniref:Uncharacterized protein n=1 Tax=Tardiphaga robiniae TaxID=943830 RepID=A0A163X3W8_9BRAD|nr:hypothetical protein A4A58_19290 [Tardiphaga robiniae]